VNVPSPERAILPEFRNHRRGRFGGAAWIFLATSMIAGVLFILINPPFWGNDGLSQYSRAYQVSHGQFLPQEIEWGGKGESYGGSIPAPVWELYTHAATDLGANPAEPEAMILEPERYDELGSAEYRSDESNLIWFTNTAAYSPVPYVPAAVASLIAEFGGASVDTALRGMALASLLAYVIPVFAALVVVRASRSRWLLLVLSLLPPALLQSATITADALTNGVALLFAALMMRVSLERRALSGLQTALLYASVLLLPLGKPSYMVLVLLVIAAPRALLRGPSWLRWAALGASTAAWGGWTLATRGISDVLAFYRSDYEQRDFGMAPMIEQTLSDPLGFIANAARTLFYRDNFFFLDLIGSSNVRVPSTAMLAMTVVVVIAIALLPRFTLSERWSKRIWIGASAISVLAIFGTLYVSFTPVGFYLIDGVQGRYFFPLWPVILLTVAAYFPLRWQLTGASATRVGVAVSSVAVAAVMVTVAKFWYVVWVGA